MHAPRPGAMVVPPSDGALPQTQIPDQSQTPDQGFAPPSASTGPPAGMSGGS